MLPVDRLTIHVATEDNVSDVVIALGWMLTAGFFVGSITLAVLIMVARTDD